MSKRPPSKNVFFGNISYGTSEDEVERLMSEAGKVVAFRMLRDKDTGKAKGYGFCEYADVQTATNAVRTLNDREINGRKIRVDFADSKQGSSNGPTPVAKSGPRQDFGGPQIPNKDEFWEALKKIPEEELVDFLQELQNIAKKDEMEFRKLLGTNPQLAIAIKHAQFILQMTNTQFLAVQMNQGMPPMGGMHLPPQGMHPMPPMGGMHMPPQGMPPMGGMPPQGMHPPPQGMHPPPQGMHPPPQGMHPMHPIPPQRNGPSHRMPPNQQSNHQGGPMPHHQNHMNQNDHRQNSHQQHQMNPMDGRSQRNRPQHQQQQQHQQQHHHQQQRQPPWHQLPPSVDQKKLEQIKEKVSKLPKPKLQKLLSLSKFDLKNYPEKQRNQILMIQEYAPYL